jgi:type I restriction enzyme S subunit
MSLPGNGRTLGAANNSVANDAPSRLKARVFAPGAVVFPKIGAAIATNKKRLLARPSLIDNNLMAVWSKDDKRVSPEFLYYWFGTIDLARLSASGPLPSITQHTVRQLTIALPSPQEQSDIVAALTALEQVRNDTSAVVTASHQLKRALMEHLFEYGPVAVYDTHTVALQTSDIGSAPSHWKVCPLAECAKVQSGVTKGRKLDASTATEVPYLRVANVQDGFLDLREIKTIKIKEGEVEKYGLRPGDVLLTEGGDIDKLGRGHIWRGEIKPCVHQNHVFAVRPDTGQLSSEYLAYLIQSKYSKAYFLHVGHRTTNLASINRTKLLAFPVLIPPANEQRAIVDRLQTVDRKIEVERKRLGALTRAFSSLRLELVTGQRAMIRRVAA